MRSMTVGALVRIIRIEKHHSGEMTMTAEEVLGDAVKKEIHRRGRDGFAEDAELLYGAQRLFSSADADNNGASRQHGAVASSAVNLFLNARHGDPNRRSLRRSADDESCADQPSARAMRYGDGRGCSRASISRQRSSARLRAGSDIGAAREARAGTAAGGSSRTTRQQAGSLRILP
jgi:hypothetical protein